MFRFQKRYFIITILLLFVEVLIAVFIHDQFIRPYVGDYLVVILIYCLLRSFIIAPVWIVAISVLIFSYVLETLQYFNLAGMLGLQHSEITNVILGNSFSWIDILAYTFGIVTVLWIESILDKPKTKMQI